MPMQLKKKKWNQHDVFGMYRNANLPTHYSCTYTCEMLPCVSQGWNVSWGTGIRRRHNLQGGNLRPKVCSCKQHCIASYWVCFTVFSNYRLCDSVPLIQNLNLELALLCLKHKASTKQLQIADFFGKKNIYTQVLM